MGDDRAVKNAQAGVEGQLRVIKVRQALLTDLKRALALYSNEEAAVGRAQKALIFKGQRTAARGGAGGSAVVGAPCPPLLARS